MSQPNPPPAVPLVSIILPVLNAERFLPQALASIQAQTYPQLEIVIVDGGSTDATLVQARQAARARILTQEGPGLASAWNTGLRAARGEFISFLESDDLWSPDKLARQVDYLQHHPAEQYVIAYVKLFLEPGCPLPVTLNPAIFNDSHIGRMPGTLMARRVLFDQIGMFEDRWRVTPDIEWFARLDADHVPGGALPQVLLQRRIHEANLTQVAGANVLKSELLHVFKQTLDRKRRQADPQNADNHDA